MRRPDSEPYVRDALIIGLAVGVFGAAFGVLATTSGFSVAQACAMSLLVFTGASQFAAAGVVGSGGDPATAVGSGLLLAARNGLYGITMSRYLTGSRLRRAALAQLTIDESTALASAQQDPADVQPAFIAGGLSVFGFWNLGTFLGAVGGEAIGDPNAFGLDAAFPAGFIALTMPALRHRPGRVAAVVGATVALVTVPFTRPGVPILLSSVGAVVALLAAGPPPDPRPDGEDAA